MSNKDDIRASYPDEELVDPEVLLDAEIEAMKQAQRIAVEQALAADREAALRDVFAAAALGALIVQEGRNYYRLEPDTLAKKSYAYAAAMLEARK